MLLIAALALIACGHKSDYQPPPLPPSPVDAGPDAAGGGGFVPITGINTGTLTITGVDPGTGPFSGGTTAVLRGSGFDDSAVIHVGGIAVQPGQITRDGKNRITIVVPAGMVGPADVEITQGDETVTLRDGFVYNALAVNPSKGAAAGGSVVELMLSGATFEDGTVVEFDGQSCSDFRIESPQMAQCKTPAHAPGIVDVIARPPDGSTPLIAKQSYEFAETLDAIAGGLSGGPISGTVNITVVADGGVGNVIPGALVMIGNDPKTARHGFTDMRGAITFSGDDIKAPLTVHTTAKCFQRSSIVSFDATDVTIFLDPSLDPTCSSDGDVGTPTKQLAATVSGELVFPGHEEFDVNTWDIVPKPKDNEIRVAYIYTTQATVDARKIPPDGTGSELARVVEGTAIAGKRGYLYRITARPAGLAVYALAGLEGLDTHEFTPYVMGIAHNVVTSPGEEVKNVDLSMTITLDHEIDVQLGNVPMVSDSPMAFQVEAHVDLGGEGLIVREVNDDELDQITRRTGDQLFRFLGQPAFVGGLSDATYFVRAGYFSTGSLETNSYTEQKRSGVRQSDQPLVLGDFVGIPVAVSPQLGEHIPDDRMLRFDIPGMAPDLIECDIYAGDTLMWTSILPGDARAVPVPDLSMIEGQSDLPAGFLRWEITAMKIDDFRYNEFQYTYLTPRYWTHDSANSFSTLR
jgi:hypothetical protein